MAFSPAQIAADKQRRFSRNEELAQSSVSDTTAARPVEPLLLGGAAAQECVDDADWSNGSGHNCAAYGKSWCPTAKNVGSERGLHVEQCAPTGLQTHAAFADV